MLDLIKNEWMKLWSKKGTWAMIMIIAVLIIGLTGLAKLSETLFENDEWIKEMEEELVDIEAQLADPDLDESVKEDLLVEKQFTEEIIFSSQSQTRESVILDTFGIMSLVTLLTVIVAGGIVSTEFSDGTIKMLLSRPVSRWKILTSKYITVILFALLASLVTYVSSVFSAFAFFDRSPEETIDFYGSTLGLSEIWGKSIYLMFLAFINVMIIATIAFMLGVLFRSTSLAIGISIFLYFTGGMIVAFLSEYSFAKFILFAHSNLTNHETGQLMFTDLSMTFSVIVVLLYTIVFLALSYVTFTKRDVTA